MLHFPRPSFFDGQQKIAGEAKKEKDFFYKALPAHTYSIGFKLHLSHQSRKSQGILRRQRDDVVKFTRRLDLIEAAQVVVNSFVSCFDSECKKSLIPPAS